MNLIKVFVVYIISISVVSCNYRNNNMDRVAEARIEKEEKLNSLLDAQGLSTDSLNLYIQAFKEEEELEVWGKNKGEKKYRLIVNYPFCTSSGELGPKRKEGDMQIPEGVYSIDRFNPKSNFHLSLGLNYPNQSDLIHSDQTAPGSDIFIHGGCSSVGCISITDDSIKELYLLAAMTRSIQNKVRVDIYPFRFFPKWQEKMDRAYKHHFGFWISLANIYSYFNTLHTIPQVTIKDNGEYKLN